MTDAKQSTLKRLQKPLASEDTSNLGRRVTLMVSGSSQPVIRFLKLAPDLFVYPNPSRNMIVLEVGDGGLSSPAIATWRDLLGRVVNTERLQFDSDGKARVQVTGLVSGTYLLTVKSNVPGQPVFFRTTLVTHLN